LWRKRLQLSECIRSITGIMLWTFEPKSTSLGQKYGKVIEREKKIICLVPSACQCCYMVLNCVLLLARKTITWLYCYSLIYEITVVNDCQHFCHFLPITCQIDIRKAKFLQKSIANDNSICRLFSKQAEINLKKLFSGYDIVSSTSELKIVVARICILLVSSCLCICFAIFNFLNFSLLSFDETDNIFAVSWITTPSERE